MKRGQEGRRGSTCIKRGESGDGMKNKRKGKGLNLISTMKRYNFQARDKYKSGQGHNKINERP